MEIEKELLDYIKKVERRTLDDYKEAEGISTGSISLPGTNITVKD